jgi:methylene-fatty-acyl-phospholipid synthase
MYWGSTLNFLGVALYHGKVAGILLTAFVFVLYWFALKWEE